MLRKLLVVDNKDDISRAKHQQLLALLKHEYGYANEKAINELERLLRQFNKVNKSMVGHHVKSKCKHLHDA